MKSTETVEIRGHLIDSGSLSRVLNDITDYGGDYVVQRFEIGHGHDRPVVRPDRGVGRRRGDPAAHADAPADPRRQPGRPGRGRRSSEATHRRRVPRRVLLQHQPRDPGAARRPLDRGREPRDGLRTDRRRRRGPHPRADPADGRRRGGDARGVRRERHQGHSARRGGGRRWGLRVHGVRRLQREAAGRARAAGRRRHARGEGGRQARCSGSAARASCTPAPRPRWSRWSRRGTSTCCSPATRWPPTTSSRPSTAPRSASTSLAARASSTATSTTSGRSTRSARPGRSAPRSTRGS